MPDTTYTNRSIFVAKMEIEIVKLFIRYLQLTLRILDQQMPIVLEN